MRRVLSMLIALAIVISYMPRAIYAADGSESPSQQETPQTADSTVQQEIPESPSTSSNSVPTPEDNAAPQDNNDTAGQPDGDSGDHNASGQGDNQSSAPDNQNSSGKNESSGPDAQNQDPKDQGHDADDLDPDENEDADPDENEDSADPEDEEDDKDSDDDEDEKDPASDTKTGNTESSSKKDGAIPQKPEKKTSRETKEKPEHVHDLQHVPASSGTCVSSGNIEYWYCTTCGGVFADSQGNTAISEVTTSPTETHRLTAVSEQPADCESDGHGSYWVCADCGQKFSDGEGTQTISEPEVFPALGHTLTYIAGSPASCEAAGTLEHWHCDRCGQNFSDEAGSNPVGNTVLPAEGHHLTHVDGTAPDCSHGGTAEYWQCSVCGQKFADAAGTAQIQEPQQLEPRGHALQHVSAKQPDCTENGVKEHWHCERCGLNFSDPEGNTEIKDVTIAAKGHNPKLVLDFGQWRAYWQCRTCHRNYEDFGCTREITDMDAWQDPGHACTHENRVHVPGKPATCTEAGNVEYWHCPDCDKNLSQDGSVLETVELSALGHDWNKEIQYQWSEDNKTCTALRTCSRDSAHKQEIQATASVQENVPAKGQTTYTAVFASAWAQTQVKVVGEAIIEPDECQHENRVHVPGKPATCTEAGNVEYWHCPDCDKNLSQNGNVLETVELPALGHDWNKEIQYQWSKDYKTCTAMRTCSRDDSHQQEAKASVTVQKDVPARGQITFTAKFDCDWAAAQTRITGEAILDPVDPPTDPTDPPVTPPDPVPVTPKPKPQPKPVPTEPVEKETEPTEPVETKPVEPEKPVPSEPMAPIDPLSPEIQVVEGMELQVGTEEFLMTAEPSRDGTVLQATLSADSLKNIRKSMAENGQAEALKFSCGSMAVSYDLRALDAILEQLEGADTIAFSVKGKNAALQNLSSVQSKAIQENPKGELYSVDLTAISDSSSWEIHDFAGGSSTITVPCCSDIAHLLTAYRVEEDGSLTEVPCEYDGETGSASFTTPSHSHYMVVSRLDVHIFAWIISSIMLMGIFVVMYQNRKGYLTNF